MILLAKTAGFCFGVRRAVQTVEQAASEGGSVVTLGPIIHNRHVVERLSSLGVCECADVDAVPEGSTVVIRSHGVDRQTCDALSARGLRVVDATCPFVSRIHRLVCEGEREGRGKG